MLPPDLQTEAHMANTALGYQLALDSYDPQAMARVRMQERARSVLADFWAAAVRSR